MAKDEIEQVAAHPLRAFRLRVPEGQPHLCVRQLSSENDGSGVVHSYAATADILEQLATALRKHAKTMPR